MYITSLYNNESNIDSYYLFIFINIINHIINHIINDITVDE